MYDFGIDIDGVLTVETAGHDYENRTPNQKNIEAVKALEGKVCFYTARQPEDLSVTSEWLSKHGLYGDIFFGKPLCKHYVDDKLVPLENLNKKTCLLFTGGMDSLIAYYYLEKPDCLYYDLNHRYAHKEKRVVREIVPDTRILNTLEGLGVYEGQNATIRARNLYLVMAAANEGYERIYLIVQQDETNIPDRTKRFFKHASLLLSELFEREIVVDTPFWNMDKTDMLNWYLETGLDLEQAIGLSTSCYDSLHHQCGLCAACFRKAVAMVNCGLLNMRHFATNPFKTDVAKDYYANRDRYSAQRKERIENAVAIYKSGNIIY